jgi:predicted NBD/HSP70 family sugar kinase
VRALGIDVGGTFTDAVLVSGGKVRTAKVPTAARQEESVVAAVVALGVEGVERFNHGTTIHQRAPRAARHTNRVRDHRRIRACPCPVRS